MSQIELNTYANQVKQQWTTEKNERLTRSFNPGTAFLRKQLRERREKIRELQQFLSSHIDNVATAT